VEHLADLQNLADFFGVEPKLEYPGLPYETNIVVFEIQIENANVWFQLIPHLSIGELRIRGTPFSITKLNLRQITRVSVRKTADDHYMSILFSAGVEPLQLHLRPLSLFWGNDVDSEEGPHLEAAS
jgi:hypothetical protein